MKRVVAAVVAVLLILGVVLGGCSVVMSSTTCVANSATPYAAPSFTQQLKSNLGECGE